LQYKEQRVDSHLEDYLRWWKNRETFALATIVGGHGSAPMPLGTAMGIGPARLEANAECSPRAVVGSLSGGCIEASVYASAEHLFTSSAHFALEHFGYSDETSFAAGLSCGGTLEVFTELVTRETFAEFGRLVEAVRNQETVALATIIDGPTDNLGRHLLIFRDHFEGRLGSDELSSAVFTEGAAFLRAEETETLVYETEGQRRGGNLRVFIRTFKRAPRMLVFGAIDFAAALADTGKLLGYHVTVCDARPIFATARRFPQADEVVCRWPHQYLQDESDKGALDASTVICVLTHDPKFDIPLLQLALQLPASYVGAMASRKTHDERLRLLRQTGVGESDIARLRSPIGLDLGARSPHETAISIVSEIIATKYGRSGGPLTESLGPIHRLRHSSIVHK
jgi:xanthine dehydrogenase accessory factor